MKKITFLLLFLGLLLSVNTQAQIPTVLTDADFTTKTGVFRDSRDGKYYAYKKYGNEDWFMQNLSYNNNGATGWAGPEDLDGSKYGRFYKVNTVSTVCPDGWKSPTNAQWGELVNTIAREYNIDPTSMKASGPNYYDLYMAMPYMRGGGLAVNGGLWLANTGIENAKSTQTQFNILPAGAFNGTGYVASNGIGQRMFFIGSNNDRYQNHNATNVVGYNGLKHNRVSSGNAYGVVRCVREAQTMKDQVIIAEEIEPKALADVEFNLVAAATSGLALTYTSSNESVATVDATGKVTIIAVGTTIITMTQLGDADFNPAYTESRVLSVSSQKYFVTLPTMEGVITSPTAGKHIVVGDNPFEFTISLVSGYEGVPVVKLNDGTTLTPVSAENETYKYRVENLVADLTVTITGIQKIAVVGFPRFAVISDVYAGRADWVAKTTKALENLVGQTPKIDAIFITGNITDGGTQSQFTQLKNLVDAKVSSDISVYYAMGNNDWLSDATASGQYFGTTMNQNQNQFIVVRGYPFITISTEAKDLASSYLLQTKAFLEEQLAYAATEYPGKPIFVVQNAPNSSTVYGSAAWGTSNITSMLEGYPQVISLSGNSHYFLANEGSIHQNKFTSINTGSVSFARTETGFDDGIFPANSENIIEGVVVSANDQNAIEVKRIDFFNNKDIKQSWTITAPHDGTAFAYKGRTGGEKPYFETGSTITIKNLADITFTLEIPAAKDDDEVTQYLIEILDVDQKLLMKPLYKFSSDYYLATSGVVATTISKDVSRLVENTDYYVRVTAIDAFGQKSAPLLSDKITTKPKDTTNPSVFDIIAERIRVDQESRVTTTSIDVSVDNLLKKYNATSTIGSFTDLNYGVSTADGWSSSVGPPVHLNRLKDMAMAYVRAGSKYYKDDDLHSKIVAATEYWYTKNPTSSNWWHASVGNPQKMGVYLLEMRKGEKKLPVVTEGKFLYRMEYGPGRQAEDGVNEGANRSDMALHYLYRACLTGDSALMTRGFVNGYEPIKIATGSEGIQVDGSYLLHGPQLQMTSYGQELMNTSVSFGSYAAGTEYAIVDAQLEILSNFARNSYFKVFRGPYIHHNSTGRSISRAGNLKRAGNARFAEALIQMDPSHKDEYETILKRLKDEEPASFGIVPLNSTFFVGDYAVHIRPEFSFAVRTVSKRTYRNEWGNGEALQVYFESDGSTSFMQKGDEYHNIPVAWNWARIPGTTAPQYPFESIPQWSATSNKPGFTNFVGGVSDGLYSANTYHLDDNWKDNMEGNPEPKHAVNTSGRKSWFFFDNEVVCLGAGINSTCHYPLNTSVEQNLLKSDIIVSTNEGEQTIAQSFKGETSYDNNLKWALHNGAGYFFPKGGKISTENITTTRSWSEINKSQSTNPISTDVFSLWFDHGLNPVDVDYAYIVAPNKNTAADMNAYDLSNIEILSNTAKIQAVKSKTSNILQVIFSEAGTLKHDNITIETDKPVALILKNIGTSEVTMHVADPAQTRSSITITTSIPSVSSEMKQTVCNFAGTGKYAGASKEFKIDKNSPSYTPPPYVPEGTPNFTIEIPVLEDTYVTDLSGQANTNFGSDSKIVAKLNDISGYHRQSYLKFSVDKMVELETVENIDDYNVQAYVELYLTRTNDDAKNSSWVITPVENTTWSENTMTWNNRPAVTDLILDTKKGRSYVASTEFNAANLVDFNITQYAFDEYKSNRDTIALNINNGIAGGKVDADFASREHATELMRPRLVLKGYKKKTQTIDFVNIPDMDVDDADFLLAATSTSGLPITYTSSNEGVIAIVEATTRSTTYLARVVGVGTATITATQAGDGEYVSVILAQEVTVTNSVGIEENENGTSLKVYPNPVLAGQPIYVDVTGMSSDFLTNSSVKVYSSIGVELKTVKLTDAVTPITIPTSGVYIIKVVSDGYKKEFKVIVK